MKLTQCKPTRPILFSCLQNRATFQGLLRPLGLSKWPVTFVAVSTCQRGEGWKLYSLQLILFNSKHSCSRQERKKDKSHTYLKFRIFLDRTPPSPPPHTQKGRAGSETLLPQLALPLPSSRGRKKEKCVIVPFIHVVQIDAIEGILCRRFYRTYFPLAQTK